MSGSEGLLVVVFFAIACLSFSGCHFEGDLFMWGWIKMLAKDIWDFMYPPA
jgi:hypothetical protein